MDAVSKRRLAKQNGELPACAEFRTVRATGVRRADTGARRTRRGTARRTSVWARTLAIATTGVGLACATPPSGLGQASERASPPAAKAAMVRMVFRNGSPALAPGSYEALPVTLHRMGECCGRLEYPPEPGSGRRILIVVAEPHAFWVDLSDRTGLYTHDPGPSQVFRAPVIEPEPGETHPLGDLEFGREYEFLLAHGAEREPAVSGTADGLERWVAKVADYTVELRAEPGSRRPRELRIHHAGELDGVFLYDAYEVLEGDAELFVPPEDVRFRRHSPGHSP